MAKNKYWIDELDEEIEIPKDAYNIEYEFMAMITNQLYYSEQSQFGTYLFVTKEELPALDKRTNNFHEASYSGKLTGNMQMLETRSEYKIKAKLVRHKKYGHSYKAIVVTSAVPKTYRSQKRFLESIFTITQAETILTEYPNIVEDVMNDRDDLDFSKLKGITKNNWIRLRDKIVENFVISDILAMLSPLGVTYKTILRLTDGQENPALLKQKIENNPYILTNVDGLGFKKVDKIAISLKPELLKSKTRAISFLKYHLNKEANENGHSWLNLTEVKNDFSTFCPECMPYFDEIIEEQKELQKTTSQTFLTFRDDSIGLTKLYLTEINIYDKLYDINNNVDENKIQVSELNIKRGMAQANSFQGFDYSPEQEEIIKSVVNGSGVQVITGYAGVGKTAVTRGVLNIFKDAGCSMSSCALSARAGIVFKETTGFDAKTIHRTLGASPMGFSYNAKNPLLIDVLVVDEVSMVNITLFWDLLKAIKSSTRVIIIGDGGQLPAIGCGNLLNDLLYLDDSKLCQINRLTKIYRQAQDSGIIMDANLIRQNRFPMKEIVPKIKSGKKEDMMYRFFNEDKDIHKLALKVYLQSIEVDGIDNVVLLAPKKDGGVNTTKVFNEEIQNHLISKEAPFIKCNDNIYKLGARVMQIKNDYGIGIMNGEIGVIIEVSSNGCVINFDDRIIPYNFVGDKQNGIGCLNEITLGYCLTIHKAQGAGYKTVIGVLDKSHWLLLDSTLLYTLITRAKGRCMLIAQPLAFRKCVTTSHSINKQNYMRYIQGRSDNPPQNPSTSSMKIGQKEPEIPEEDLPF